MTFREWLHRWDMSGLRIKDEALEKTWEPTEADRDAAWQLHIELVTRITTQPLPDQDGDEAAALTSVYQFFGITREILREGGPECIGFATVAIPVLNQILRPFTSTWHKRSLAGEFDDPRQCEKFRQELRDLRDRLRSYSSLLAHMAGVEDLTVLEPEAHR